MNQFNLGSNCYTNANCIYPYNYDNTTIPYYPINNMPAIMQTGVPMFPLYGYDNTEDYDRDVTYMKQIYPKAVLQIQKEVDEECDKLEYDGSCMFDQYPDKSHLNMIVDTIYERVASLNTEPDSLESLESKESKDVHSNQCRPFFPPCDSRDRRCHPHPRPDYNNGQPDWLRGIIGVLLFNEMNHRRRRYRSRKRWF